MTKLTVRVSSPQTNYMDLATQALAKVGVQAPHLGLQVAVAGLLPGGALHVHDTFELDAGQVRQVAESFLERRSALTDAQRVDLFVRRQTMAFLYPGQSLLEVAQGMVRNHLMNIGAKDVDEAGATFRSMVDTILERAYEANGFRPKDPQFEDPVSLRVTEASGGLSILLPNPLFLFSDTGEPLLPVMPDWDEMPPGLGPADLWGAGTND